MLNEFLEGDGKYIEWRSKVVKYSIINLGLKLNIAWIKQWKAGFYI
jgi:hypothetical protein